MFRKEDLASFSGGKDNAMCTIFQCCFELSVVSER